MPNQNNSFVILASHSGNGRNAYFKNLHKLELKDKIYLDYNNNKYTYEVSLIYDEIKDGMLPIKRYYDRDELVLITCKGKKWQTIYIAFKI